MNQQNISVTETERKHLSMFAILRREKFTFIAIFLLLLVAFLIELSPKWDESFRISLSPGHSFTNQDLPAVIAVAIALVLTVRLIRKYLPDIKHYIESEPYKALTLTFIFSSGFSLMLGVGLGMLFKTPLVDFLGLVFKPLQTLIFG